MAQVGVNPSNLYVVTHSDIFMGIREVQDWVLLHLSQLVMVVVVALVSVLVPEAVVADAVVAAAVAAAANVSVAINSDGSVVVAVDVSVAVDLDIAVVSRLLSKTSDSQLELVDVAWNYLRSYLQLHWPRQPQVRPRSRQ